MIKLVFLMRRKPGVSVEAFKHHWLNPHAELIRQHWRALKIRRYVQSHAVAPDHGAALRPAWHDAEAWDGIAEIWLDSLEVLAGSRGTPEMDAIQAALIDDEQHFVDLARSTMFITEEHEITP